MALNPDLQFRATPTLTLVFPYRVRGPPFSDVAFALGEVCIEGNSGRVLLGLRSRLLTRSDHAQRSDRRSNVNLPAHSMG